MYFTMPGNWKEFYIIVAINFAMATDFKEIYF